MFEAIQNWLESFLPAYRNGSVLESETLPWITYNLSINERLRESVLTVNIYASTDIEADTEAMNICNALKDGGVILRFSGGAVWVKGGTFQSYEETNIKHRVINLTIENLTR